ncbi:MULTISPECIES: SprT-like domain-containing protein [Thioalkalivibrio]|uniref:SprT domain-containing protein n=1 Tax=Thioalkalivibrio halophilus TaxID=252474 RepID=A0A1V2ZVF9_9GAMM|nr:MULTISPECIES: SprT-like domain-containing protein [Thioalkalivibrio]OOC09117.1 sprT domain-containing protein [Thioalkalivibrio halophilus]
MTDCPTLSMYSALQQAFDHFNERLFDNELPPCLITLRSSRRQRGYHHAERFISGDGTIIHELGVHPGYFTLNPLEVALSTLVHEMVHHWQECFGRPSRSNHHNREWVGKMEAIGLVPSDTGLPDGKQTGRRVTHYIQPAGPFARACSDLLATGFELPWFDRHAPTDPESVAQVQEALAEQGLAVASAPAPAETIPLPDNAEKPAVFAPPAPRPDPRVRMNCPTCDARVWARPETEVVCGSCMEPMSHASEDAG